MQSVDTRLQYITNKSLHHSNTIVYSYCYWIWSIRYAHTIVQLGHECEEVEAQSAWTQALASTGTGKPRGVMRQLLPRASIAVEVHDCSGKGPWFVGNHGDTTAFIIAKPMVPNLRVSLVVKRLGGDVLGSGFGDHRRQTMYMRKALLGEYPSGDAHRYYKHTCSSQFIRQLLNKTELVHTTGLL